MTDKQEPTNNPREAQRIDRVKRRRLIRRIEFGIFLSIIIGVIVFLWVRTPPDELARIKDSGVLRVASTNGPTTYYIGSSGPTGFEYDLVEAFAKTLGVKVKWIFTSKWEKLLPMVEYGRADLAAAEITVTPEREKRVRFGPEYEKLVPQLIYRMGEYRPKNVKDLIGRQLIVPADSRYVVVLEKLKEKYPGFNWKTAENKSADELLYNVSRGKLAYTLVNSNIFALNRRFYPRLGVAFAIGKPRAVAWAMQKTSDQSLYDAVKKFFKKIKKSGELQRIEERYFGHARHYDVVGTLTFMQFEKKRLPPLIPWFKQAAKKYGFPWQLLAAQSYQESYWDPRAVSPTGVRGLMMLTPAAAKQIGGANPLDPKESIMGGAAYLKKMMSWIPSSVKGPDRLWFALAAYNVGIGHVLDAMRLAKSLGKNPDRWTSLKQTLPLLTEPKWYRRTANGYASGRVAVRYVQNIRSYYDILVWMSTHKSGAMDYHPFPALLLNLPPSL